MKRMGLEQAFRAKRAPEEGMQMVDNTGRQRAWLPATKSKAGEKQGFTTEYEIMRGDICRILYDAAVSDITQAGVKTSAKYIFGTAVESFVQNIPRGDMDAEKEAMANIYQGAGWQSDEIVEAMKKAPDFYCERLGLVKLAPWSRGRVTLVGDAAYCPTVLTGIGTTSAMVGAYILAGEIERHAGRPPGKWQSSDGLVTALESYEAKSDPLWTRCRRELWKTHQSSG